MDATIEQGLATPGAVEMTARYRQGARRVVFEGGTFLRPTIVWCHSFSHPLANREFLFPFDFLANYDFGHPAPVARELNLATGARNVQFPVLAQMIWEAPDPNKTCGFGQDPRDPSRQCSLTDGHGEIIGCRDATPGATDPVPIAVRAREWPAKDEAGLRRQALIEMATAGNDWAHRPENPGLCMVSDDMISILKLIMSEEAPPADVTAPNTVAMFDPAANVSGWHNGDVAVTLTATDDPHGTGVRDVAYSLAGAHVEPQVVVPGSTASMVLSAEGETTLTFFARDLAQPVNVEEAKALGVWIDRTTPEIQAVTLPPPNAEGWNATDVWVSFVSTDALSGVAATTDPVFVTTEGIAQEIVGTATDFAGNQASASAILNIDKTAPALAIDVPPQDGTYLLHAAATSAYGCEDLLSGLRACAGPVPSGAPLDTASVGAKLFTVNALDAAGNQTTRTHRYSVVYGFSGFQRPVSPFPTVNVSKAGSTVPLKWALHDASGGAILDLTAVLSIESAAVACASGAPAADLEPVEPTGQTSLRIEDGVFTYTWKTSAAWRGCRLLELMLLDGTTHRLVFSFR
jgi:hypothetical protein